MTVRNSRSAASDHRRHDRLLVARFAAGDAENGQEREAAALIRHCTECAALAEDIKSITSAVAALPAARRPRDFRISAEQADTLRGSRLERWLRTLTGSGWAVVRPAAAVALSIGLVMSVVGGLPMVGAALPAGAPTNDFLDVNRNRVDAPLAGQGGELTPDESSGVAALGSSDSVNRDGDQNPLDNAYMQTGPAEQPAPGKIAPIRPSPSIAPQTLGTDDVLLIAGVSTTVLALALLGLLYAARRRFADPLLR